MEQDNLFSREIYHPLDIIYSLKIAVYLCVVAIGVWGVLKLDGWYILAMQVLLGAVYAHGIELTHQALHLTGFSNKRMNRFFGVLMGIPMLVSFSGYQDSHFYHHQNVGTPKDNEFFNYGNRNSLHIWDLITHFFLINHFIGFLKCAWISFSTKEFQCKILKDKSSKIKNEYRIISILFFGALLYTMLSENLILISIWLVPVFVFSAPIHALIELPEHYGCNSNSKSYLENTRTIQSNAFMTWFTNGNNFHVEHHLRPAAPIEKLKDVHNEIGVGEKITYKNKTYREFYIGFIKDFFSKK